MEGMLTPVNSRSPFRSKRRCKLLLITTNLRFRSKNQLTTKMSQKRKKNLLTNPLVARMRTIKLSRSKEKKERGRREIKPPSKSNRPPAIRRFLRRNKD